MATLNRTELGKRTASVAEVSALLAIYGVVGPERKRIMDLVEEVIPAGWFSVGRRLNLLTALTGFEARATAITTFSPSHVPGLLQTADYARSIIRFGGVAAGEVERRVAQRLERQQVLFKASRPAYLAILDEAVLRRPVGGSAAMAGQLRWLAEVGNQPNVDIRVIPFRHGAYDMAGYFSVFEFACSSSLVYLENMGAPGFLHDPRDTDRFAGEVASLEKMALDSADSVDFLARIATDHDRG